LKHAEERLIAHFGPLEAQSSLLPFHFTQYYRPEMGDLLGRKFVSFRTLIKKEDLVPIKGTAIELERFFAASKDGFPGRRINLDPGLFDAE
jgi:hypothetical protein